MAKRRPVGTGRTSQHRPICHADGSLTYWDPVTEGWVRRHPTIPERLYHALSGPDRRRVREHRSAVIRVIKHLEDKS